MATVARLLPRHWDGRRLLQFLTGLALIALAFAIPALTGPAGPPAEAPVPIITTVDTPPGPGLPVADSPVETGLALEAEAAADAPAAVTDTTEASGTSATATAQTATAQTATGRTATGQAPIQAGHAGRICADAQVVPGGPARRAHSERGPPQA